MKQSPIALLVIFGACSSPPPVGFYDTTRIVAESAVAKAMFASADQAVAPKRTEAKKAIDEFHAAQLMPLSPAELQRRGDGVQQLVDAANGETQRARKEAGTNLDARLAVIAARAGARHRMRIVMSLNGRPPFAEPGSDLTTEIIAELDGLDPKVARARAEAAAALEQAGRLNDEAIAAAALSPPSTVKQ